MLGTGRIRRILTRVAVGAVFAGVVTAGVVLPASPASADVCGSTPQYNVDCSGANFDGATVNFSAGPTYSSPTVDFFGVSAVGAHLTGVAFSAYGTGNTSNFGSANFTNATFTGFQGMWASFNGANFIGANLSNGNFQSATFGSTSFSGAHLLGANLAGINWGNNTSLTGSDLVPADVAVVSAGGNPVAVAYTIPENTTISGVSGVAPPSCAPASGSLFSVGATTVTCSVPSRQDLVISGTTYPVPSTATGTFTVTVHAAAVVTASAIAPFTVGVAGSSALTATGSGTLSWQLTSGSLPSGVTLAADGTLSGTPAPGAAGSYAFGARLTQSIPGVTPDGTTDIAATFWVHPAVSGVTGNSASIGSSPYRAGSSIQIIAEGYLEDTVVEIWLDSTPTLLGTQTIGASGQLSLLVTIPPGIPAGAHTIRLVAQPPGGGQLQTFSYPVTVTRPAAATGARLPATGPEIPGGLTGLAILAVAAGAVVWRRESLRDLA